MLLCPDPRSGRLGGETYRLRDNGEGGRSLPAVCCRVFAWLRCSGGHVLVDAALTGLLLALRLQRHPN